MKCEEEPKYYKAKHYLGGWQYYKREPNELGGGCWYIRRYNSWSAIYSTDASADVHLVNELISLTKQEIFLELL